MKIGDKVRHNRTDKLGTITDIVYLGNVSGGTDVVCDDAILLVDVPEEAEWCPSECTLDASSEIKRDGIVTLGWVKGTIESKTERIAFHVAKIQELQGDEPLSVGGRRFHELELEKLSYATKEFERLLRFMTIEPKTCKRGHELYSEGELCRVCKLLEASSVVSQSHA